MGSFIRAVQIANSNSTTSQLQGRWWEGGNPRKHATAGLQVTIRNTHVVGTPSTPPHFGAWQNNRTPLGVPLSALEVEKNPDSGTGPEAHGGGVRDRTPTPHLSTKL